LIVSITRPNTARLKPLLEREVARHHEIATSPRGIVAISLVCVRYVVVGHVQQIRANVIVNHNGVVVGSQSVEPSRSSTANRQNPTSFE
ncbi:hypothetical protein RFX30_07300, partial [Acinetobacter baumannii]|nr:hypothetical protein [Acinetobacter baumannii]